MNIEEMNALHVVEDINGNVLTLCVNKHIAIVTSRLWNRSMSRDTPYSTIIRLANGDDMAAFGRRLVDA